MVAKFKKTILLLGISTPLVASIFSAACEMKEPTKHLETTLVDIRKYKINPITNDDYENYTFKNFTNFGLHAKGIDFSYRKLRYIIPDINLTTPDYIYFYSSNWYKDIFERMLQKRNEFLSNDFSDNEYKRLFDRYIIKDHNDEYNYEFFSRTNYFYEPDHRKNLIFARHNTIRLSRTYEQYKSHFKPFWDNTNKKANEFNKTYNKLISKYDEKFFDENYLITINNIKSVFYHNIDDGKEPVKLYIKPTKIRSISLNENNLLDINYEWELVNASKIPDDSIDLNLQPCEIIIPKTKRNRIIMDHVVYVNLSSAYTTITNERYISYIEYLLRRPFFYELDYEKK
ncbi:hypothetical protein PT305_01880 [Metamycoplasma hyosynoviae]|uniref:hypothetical protein n=1 Tax=Metamycoplasma hyosynoviae TaxID=29559 RepID=UPI00235F999D|nr:hypothetical protein [Metamycoplasma hyosynoviae]MDD1360085.1 hypothetical protein [Metamycoplasma hyosynoviae]